MHRLAFDGGVHGCAPVGGRQSGGTYPWVTYGISLIKCFVL
jgi:hypothetical protein